MEPPILSGGIGVVEFTRIGRTHDVPPLGVTVRTLDDIAAQVHQYARRFLGSRDVSVTVDEDGGVQIWAGFRNGGEGVWRPIDSDDDPPCCEDCEGDVHAPMCPRWEP